MSTPQPLQNDAGGNYLAYRAEVPNSAAGDALLKEMGSGEAPAGTPQAPATSPVQTSGDLTSLITGKPQHGVAYRIGADMLKGAVETPRAIYTGARDAVINAYDMISDFGKTADQWQRQKALAEVGQTSAPAPESQEEFDAKMQRTADEKAMVDKRIVSDPQSVTGGLVKGVSQFLTGLALTKKLMPTPDLTGVAKWGYSALQGAAANFTAFDPHQQRLSNLIEKFPALSNPVTEYLASKPGDTDAEGRFKNALEGLGLGILTDGFMKGVRLLGGLANAKGAIEAPAPTTEPGLPDNAFRELGDSHPDAPLVSDQPFGGPPAPAEPPPGRNPLGNYLRRQDAEMKTAGVNPEEVLAGQKPQPPIESSAEGAKLTPPRPFINFAKIDTPEDVQNVMQTLGDKFQKNIDSARRGTQTFEEIKLNSQMENAWDLLQNRRTGEPLNAEQSVAARELWASSADKLKTLAETAVAAPTEENLFAFRKMMATHYAIQSEVIGARTETARALASWRIPVGSSASRLQDITDRMMNLSGGMDNVKLMAQRVAGMAEAGQWNEINAAVEKSAYARTRDALIQAFSDGLLTSPVTQAKILASNVSTGIWRVGERAWASKISQALGTQGGVEPGEAAAMWSGWVGSFKDAMAYGWKAAKSGVTGEGIGEPHEPYPSNISSEALNLGDHPWLGRAADFIGNALSLGRRGIAAQHDVALTMAYRGELNAQALRQAMSEVNAGELEQSGVGERVAELLANPPDAMTQAARDGAKYQAFLDEPGPIAQWLLDGRKTIPALRVIAPFIKIPARIMSYTFERTPLAPLMSDFRAKIAAGGATRDLALAQMSMGTMIAMTAADMTMNGTLKGGGPPQKGLEQAQEREGAMRDSLKVGSRWYNINGVHPVGKLMLLAADVAEAITGGQQELHQDADTEKLAVGTALAIGRTLVDNSYFQGFANLFATLHDARVGGAGEGAMLSTAGSTIPAAVGALDRALDPYQREVYSMLDEFKSKIPGLSQRLPPRRNLWGEPIPSGHDPITNFISPVKIADEKHEPIDDEILRQGFNITMPDRQQTFKSGNTSVPIDMSQHPAAYSRLLELSGNELKHPAWDMGLKDLLNGIVSGTHPLSAVYNLKSDGPEGGKEVMIRDLIAQYRDLAKKQVLDEFPAIQQEVDNKADAKRALKLGVQ